MKENNDIYILKIYFKLAPSPSVLWGPTTKMILPHRKNSLELPLLNNAQMHEQAFLARPSYAIYKDGEGISRVSAAICKCQA